ncbi:M14 family zinc carboxypeptidase [Actinophytocola sp.]|uniref:M14 family metallopeptidase n=1 Tax=Actinophytocola sp. TaxID=1872138 RepID=UPI003899C440
MARRASLIIAVVVGLGAVVPAAGAQPGWQQSASTLELYEVTGAAGTGDRLEGLGMDVVTTRPSGDGERVEVVASPADTGLFGKLHLDPRPVRDARGRTQAAAAAEQAADGYQVWRSYSEPGGIADQLRRLAAANPDVVRLTSIGKSLQGKDILAAKVTANARSTRDGARPAVLYLGTQHAREWISTEVTMRLLKHVLAGKRGLRGLLSGTELWFVPVANPDGYDFTFTEGNRLWRKNLRDNDGDGKITGVDGVDLNRNFATRFGYDEEGASSLPSSDKYRGTAPNSEPETRAVDRLLRKIGFAFMVNYHSYGAEMLYPSRWQIPEHTIDDPVYEALSGDYGNPGIPGFSSDPSVGPDNGELSDHAHGTYGTLSWLIELDEGCDGCGFVFPDDEALVEAEFQKNLPFAMDVANSARTPADPVSHLGTTTPDFVVDDFPVSYGTEQPVQVDVKRRLGPVRLHYRVNGGREVSADTGEWQGGERYGKDYDAYYHRMRGTVRGTAPGDRVTVWFTTRGARSAEFTYTVAGDIGGDVLVLATEDVTGAAPAQQGTTAKYASAYVAALEAAGYSADVYDMDANGRVAPDPLGVLGHYRAIVWETGDDVVPRNADQPSGTISRGGVLTELAVRDYLNEGGKLLHTGAYASYAQNSNGGYVYQPDPDLGECTGSDDPRCVPAYNNFQQYYLGAYVPFDEGGADPATGRPYALTGRGGAFDGFSATLEPGHTSSFLATSAVLGPDRFPQFASSAAIGWDRPNGPFAPHTGRWDAYSGIADLSWKRLTTTVDLTGKSTGALSFWVSMSTEADWDFFTVEAHTVGKDDWTTLPDTQGHTSRSTGDSCADGLRELHPFIEHYEDADCGPTGTTGEWNAASGDSGGWQQWTVDLSAYAGEKVELSLSYISDWENQGAGVFVDDAAVTLDGAPAAQTSFEDGLDGFTVPGPPAGSEPPANDWTRSDKALAEGAGIVTDDTVYLGFGAERLTDPAMLADLVRRSMAHLLG